MVIIEEFYHKKHEKEKNLGIFNDLQNFVINYELVFKQDGLFDGCHFMLFLSGTFIHSYQKIDK